jgi:hypothetical protein
VDQDGQEEEDYMWINMWIKVAEERRTNMRIKMAEKRRITCGSTCGSR